MTDLLLYILLAIFLAHLTAFAALGMRRRQKYYIALVLTFSLLSLSIALRLWWPDWVMGQRPLFEWLRYLAWLAAAVSVGWTLTRIVQRRRSAT